MWEKDFTLGYVLTSATVLTTGRALQSLGTLG